jgi:hypothetical protein
MTLTVNDIAKSAEDHGLIRETDDQIKSDIKMAKAMPFGVSDEQKTALGNAEGLSQQKFGGHESQAIAFVEKIKGTGVGKLDFNQLTQTKGSDGQSVAAELVDLQKKDPARLDKVINGQYKDAAALGRAIDDANKPDVVAAVKAPAKPQTAPAPAATKHDQPVTVAAADTPRATTHPAADTATKPKEPKSRDAPAVVAAADPPPKTPAAADAKTPEMDDKKDTDRKVTGETSSLQGSFRQAAGSVNTKNAVNDAVNQISNALIKAAGGQDTALGKSLALVTNTIKDFIKSGGLESIAGSAGPLLDKVAAASNTKVPSVQQFDGSTGQRMVTTLLSSVQQTASTVMTNKPATPG